MLLSGARFLALPQPREDAVLLQQSFASSTLDFNHLVLLDVFARWDAVEIKVFTQNDDASTVLQHVTSVALHRLNGHCAWRGRILTGLVKGLVIGGLRDSLSDMSEEFEHVL
jgi:hypothetical protein